MRLYISAHAYAYALVKTTLGFLCMHSGTISVTDLWLELNKLCWDIWFEVTLYQSR